MQQYRNIAATPANRPIVGATVTVTLAAGGTPTLYSDNGSTALGSNVLTTDSLGEYTFYAANGRYSLLIEASGYDDTTLDVVLWDPADQAFAASLSITDHGSVTSSEAAANATFDAAVAAISSAGVLINPKGSLVDFEAVTIPNAVMVLDAAGQRIITSNVGVGKSEQAGGGHLLIRDARANQATRTHIEPNGFVSGTAAKLDMMFDAYEDDGTNYRIANFYAKNYDAADASTTAGNNGIAVLGLKATGQPFGVWPALHVGFSDDGPGGAVPLKVYYFDTSDTAWRTPLLGAWREGVAVESGDYMLANNKLYQSGTTGTTGATRPSHTSSTASDGTITWTFVRDFAASASSIKACVVIGDRDDLPKFGHSTQRLQIASEVGIWNTKKIQFFDQNAAVTWNVYAPLNSDDLYIESADGNRRIRLDSAGEFVQITGMAVCYSTITAADADTTPSVKGTRTVIFENTGATNVTAFDEAVAYQEFLVQSSNGNTTLVHSANLVLAGGVNKTMAATDVLMFQTNGDGTIARQIL